jgi:hypothetical protein
MQALSVDAFIDVAGWIVASPSPQRFAGNPHSIDTHVPITESTRRRSESSMVGLTAVDLTLCAGRQRRRDQLMDHLRAGAGGV